jgi:DNA-binding transcriptional MocR family regulator
MKGRASEGGAHFKSCTCQAALIAAVEAAVLTVIPIPVDCEGIRADALAPSEAEAVFLTPAHQFPLGAVMSGERRAAVLAWLRDQRAVAVGWFRSQA